MPGTSVTDAPFALRRPGVILAVADVDRSIAFYREHLGFAVEATFDAPAYAILARDGFRLSLAEQGHPADDLPGVVPTAPADGARPPAMLVLEVPDCDAAHDALRSAGVAFASEVFRPPWGGARCFARDPDGHLIELEELP
jgi:catechol 2,3-dioxygenase-like lactoylglutathione lyase family enzyme